MILFKDGTVQPTAFKITTRSPLDLRSSVEIKEDLINPSGWIVNGIVLEPYDGIITTVVSGSQKGVYWLDNIDDKDKFWSVSSPTGWRRLLQEGDTSTTGEGNNYELNLGLATTLTPPAIPIILTNLGTASQSSQIVIKSGNGILLHRDTTSSITIALNSDFVSVNNLQVKAQNIALGGIIPSLGVEVTTIVNTLDDNFRLIQGDGITISTMGATKNILISSTGGYVLPAASSTILGGIKIPTALDTPFCSFSMGSLAKGGPNEFLILNQATINNRGGIRIEHPDILKGGNKDILGFASKFDYGVVKIGSGIAVTNGVISIDPSITGSNITLKFREFNGCNKINIALVEDVTNIVKSEVILEVGEGLKMIQSVEGGKQKLKIELGSCGEIPKTFAVSATTSGEGGTVTPSDHFNVNQGSSCTFTVNTNPGYKVTLGTTTGDATFSWSPIKDSNSFIVSNVQSNCTVHFIFSPEIIVKEYTIYPIAGTGGTISPNTNVIIDGTQDEEFTISASKGYVISEITITNLDTTNITKLTGVEGLTTTKYTFVKSIQTTNYKIEATFKAEELAERFTVISTKGVGGTIKPEGTIEYDKGESPNYEIIPDACYEIDNVIVDTSESTKTDFYTFVNISKNHTINATFKKKTFVIRVRAEGDCMIRDTNSTGTVVTNTDIIGIECGSNKTLYFEGIPPYIELQEITVNGVKTVPTTSDTIALTNIQSDLEVKFVFVEGVLIGVVYDIDEKGVDITNGKITPVGNSFLPGYSGCNTHRMKSVVIPKGTAQKFDIVPNKGYKVKSVYTGFGEIGPDTCESNFLKYAVNHGAITNYEFGTSHVYSEGSVNEKIYAEFEEVIELADFEATLAKGLDGLEEPMIFEEVLLTNHVTHGEGYYFTLPRIRGTLSNPCPDNCGCSKFGFQFKKSLNGGLPLSNSQMQEMGPLGYGEVPNFSTWIITEEVINGEDYRRYIFNQRNAMNASLCAEKGEQHYKIKLN